MERTIIGLCGAAGAGKDEAARALKPFGFQKRSFAEPLRREVYEALCKPKESRKTLKKAPDVTRQAFYACYQHCDFDPWKKPTSHDMRRLLQTWGTEFRRGQDPDYWVRQTLGSLPETGCFVFTDLRYPNEYRMIRALGGYVFRVDNPHALVLDHVSESYWPYFSVSRAINNNGTKEELHAAMLSAIRNIPCLAAVLSSSSGSAPQTTAA